MCTFNMIHKISLYSFRIHVNEIWKVILPKLNFIFHKIEPNKKVLTPQFNSYKWVGDIAGFILLWPLLYELTFPLLQYNIPNSLIIWNLTISNLMRLVLYDTPNQYFQHSNHESCDLSISHACIIPIKETNKGNWIF